MVFGRTKAHADGKGGVYRCRVCDEMWRERSGGKPGACPNCGAKRIATVPVVGGAVEYALADRSEGYALEDIRFGKIAVWGELISANQYTETLNAQRQIGRNSARVPSLGDLLVKQRALTRKQFEAVLRVRARAWQDAAEEEFGETMVSRNLLSRERLLELKRAQMAVAEKGETPPPLSLLAFEKRMLTEKETVVLLQAQARNGKGLLAMLREEIGETVSPGVLILGRKGSRERKVRLGIAAALVPLLLIIVAGRVAGERVYVATQCEGCRDMRSAPLDSKWPIKCRKCEEMQVYPLYICRRCAHKFTVHKPGSRGLKCPNCNSDNIVPLTKDVSEQEIRANATMESGRRVGSDR